MSEINQRRDIDPHQDAWRADITQRFQLSQQQHAELKANVEALKADVTDLKAEMQANSAATTRVETNTKDLVDTFQGMALLFKVLKWMAIAVTTIGGAVTAMWGMTHLSK